jgi:hypothetical protein
MHDEKARNQTIHYLNSGTLHAAKKSYEGEEI